MTTKTATTTTDPTTLELHATSVSGEGTMSMAEKEGGFDIPVGESLVLEPGDAHIMMLDLDMSAITGSIELTLVFDSTEVTVSAELRDIGDTPDGVDGMDGMDDMDDMGS